jgi:pilus assembly protein CpaB
MNRNRLFVGLAAAVAVAALLSIFVYHEFTQQMAAVRPAPVQGHLVVALRALQIGTRLDASNLRLIDWPSSEVVPGTFSRIEDCANRALITPVGENEPILENRLAPQQAGAGLPAIIPEGMRALTVAVNDVIGVAGFVIPGTMVDVLVTGNLSGGSGGNSITRTILENVRVMAAGQQIQQDRDGKPVTVPVITLLVTPDDATRLTMASTEGKIQLALRNTIDAKVTDPAPVLQSTLFGGAPAPPPKRVSPGKPAPPAPPPPPFVIEIITGSKRETKEFPNQ